MTVKELINKWNSKTFKEEPVQYEIPSIIINDMSIMRDRENKKSLADTKQNGYVTSYVKNDVKKCSDAEKYDFFSLSKIFRELYHSDKLSPANYVSFVIHNLWLVDVQREEALPKDFYLGYVTRSLRAFASYLRELDLEEKIKECLKEICEETGKTYEMIETSWEDDVKNKTDVMFKYDGKTYRCWSYQTSGVGTEKTGKRILRGCGKGYNITIPFNLSERVEYCGWYLYDKDVLKKNLMMALSSTPVAYEEFKERIIDTRFAVVKDCNVFCRQNV